MARVDVGALRTLYQTDTSGGAKVTEAQANELAKGADSAEGREYLEQRLETDSFDPKARAILDQAISSQESSAEKDVDKATGLGPSGIVGKTAGSVGKVDVTFKRDLGPKEGFDSKEQARAAAVLNGKPAALVQDKAGKWHAGELSVDPKSLGGPFNANGSAERVRQPVQADIDQAKQDYRDDPSAENYRKLVVASLGVDDKDVVLAKGDPLQLEPGKINVTLGRLNGGSASATTGYVKSSGASSTTAMPTDGTDPGKSTIVMGQGATNTKKFQDTYLHETTHQAHDQRSKDLVNQWQGDPKASKQPFDKWLIDQNKAGKVSDTDFKLTQQATNKSGGTVDPQTTATEALAYTKAFINSYGNGVETNQVGTKPELNFTFDQLLGAGEKKHEPPDAVKKEVGKELRQMYDGLPADKQKEFRDYTAAHFASSWLKDYLPR